MVRTSKWSHFQWLQHSILMFFFLRKMLPDNSQNHGYRWWKIWKNPRRWKLIVTWLATGSYILYIYIYCICTYVYTSRAGFSSINNSFSRIMFVEPSNLVSNISNIHGRQISLLLLKQNCATPFHWWWKLMFEKPQGQPILMKRCIQWTFETRHLKNWCISGFAPSSNRSMVQWFKVVPTGDSSVNHCGRKSSHS